MKFKSIMVKVPSKKIISNKTNRKSHFHSAGAVKVALQRLGRGYTVKHRLKYYQVELNS
jgi:hypothetical protein